MATTEIFEKYIHELKDLSEEFLNQKCIVTTWFHQYAPGIGGTHKAVHIYLKTDGNGWPYDAAAYKAAKDAGIRPYEKRGRDEGYGEVGCKQYKRTAMSIRNALRDYGRYVFKFEPMPEAKDMEGFVSHLTKI